MCIRDSLYKSFRHVRFEMLPISMGLVQAALQVWNQIFIAPLLVIYFSGVFAKSLLFSLMCYGFISISKRVVKNRSRLLVFSEWAFYIMMAKSTLVWLFAMLMIILEKWDKTIFEIVWWLLSADVFIIAPILSEISGYTLLRKIDEESKADSKMEIFKGQAFYMEIKHQVKTLLLTNRIIAVLTLGWGLAMIFLVFNKINIVENHIEVTGDSQLGELFVDGETVFCLAPFYFIYYAFYVVPKVRVKSLRRTRLADDIILDTSNIDQVAPTLRPTLSSYDEKEEDYKERLRSSRDQRISERSRDLSPNSHNVIPEVDRSEDDAPSNGITNHGQKSDT
eukprot:TRINITY_DN9305_c0_g1_i4.p1 TRINITY_DN9305_c0_g1~~TRINITY_DN9305_c0_g1_i4.p1  ORF type:complete len:336 (+),score=41.80 TRINITY_DN9305_c0_g1_i4:64-1071(+)